MKIKITGTGSYTPEKVLTNIDLEKIVDTNDEWITARTGIRERHIAAEGENTSDLALIASQRALEMANVAPDEIDQIIVGTITGDMPWPATACILQEKLGAKNASAYDLSAACSGFVYALSNAYAYLNAGFGKKVLVVGAEVLSRIVDWTDRNTCILFGDGAGAVVLERVEEDGDDGVLSCHLHSDGSYVDLLYQPGFGTMHQPSAEGIDQKMHFLRMQGNEVFKVAVRSLSDVSQEALKANGFTAADVDLFIPHQANRRILDATAKRIGLDEDKVFINVHNYGNTSSATIPIALDEAWRGGQLKRGDLLLLSAFGGGFTWGSALIRW